MNHPVLWLALTALVACNSGEGDTTPNDTGDADDTGADTTAPTVVWRGCEECSHSTLNRSSISDPDAVQVLTNAA